MSMIDSRRKPITTSSSDQVPPSSGPRWRMSGSEPSTAGATSAAPPAADRNPISPHTPSSIQDRRALPRQAGARVASPAVWLKSAPSINPAAGEGEGRVDATRRAGPPPATRAASAPRRSSCRRRPRAPVR